MKRWLATITLSLTLCGALLATTNAAYAVELSEIESLMRSGNYSAALEKSETYARANPTDPAGRFSRGLILVKLNRVDEAIEVFNQLTRDYPRLPEPYNNLAVLHAQRKDFDKAQRALESAIATNPSYATAHENLGDIYAIKAAVAYSKALEIAPENRSLQGKLQMLERLNPGGNGSVGTAVASAATPRPATPTPPVTNIPATPRIPTTPAVRPSTPSTPAVAPTAAQTKPAVENAVNGWARAWSSKNTAAYLNSYSPNFEPDDMTRSAWQQQRRKRLQKPGNIKVNLSNIEIEFLDATIAWVSFKQRYQSANYSDQVTKTLLMEYINGQWRILREDVVN